MLVLPGSASTRRVILDGDVADVVAADPDHVGIGQAALQNQAGASSLAGQQHVAAQDIDAAVCTFRATGAICFSAAVKAPHNSNAGNSLGGTARYRPKTPVVVMWFPASLNANTPN